VRYSVRLFNRAGKQSAKVSWIWRMGRATDSSPVRTASVMAVIVDSPFELCRTWGARQLGSCRGKTVRDAASAARCTPSG
jgi:hypothetical protein